MEKDFQDEIQDSASTREIKSPSSGHSSFSLNEDALGKQHQGKGQSNEDRAARLSAKKLVWIALSLMAVICAISIVIYLIVRIGSYRPY